jgi:regulator of protease activity HflC (stomatin/prohibitin superfamily)
MNELFMAIRQFLLGLRPWVSVTPWEQAIRVRVGKHVRLLNPGLHWKFPILDVVYLQSTRLRVSSFGGGRQTLSTTDGKNVTLCGSIAYSIHDIERLYRVLHHAEDSLQCIARGRIAEFITSHKLAECGPEDLTRIIGSALSAEFTEYGLSDVALYLSDYALVRTYRIIGDWGASGIGSSLDTSTPVTRMS